jgi:hypothetical protein
MASFAAPPAAFDRWSSNGGQPTAGCPSGFTCKVIISEQGMFQQSLRDSTGNVFFHMVVIDENADGRMTLESYVDGTNSPIEGISAKQNVLVQGTDSLDSTVTLNTGWANSGRNAIVIDQVVTSSAVSGVGYRDSFHHEIDQDSNGNEIGYYQALRQEVTNSYLVGGDGVNPTGRDIHVFESRKASGTRVSGGSANLPAASNGMMGMKGSGGGGMTGSTSGGTTTSTSSTQTLSDGTVVTTTTNADGSITEVATAPDGSVTTTTTNPDGSQTVTAQASDGTITGTQTFDSSGSVIASTGSFSTTTTSSTSSGSTSGSTTTSSTSTTSGGMTSGSTTTASTTTTTDSGGMTGSTSTTTSGGMTGSTSTTSGGMTSGSGAPSGGTLTWGSGDEVQAIYIGQICEGCQIMGGMGGMGGGGMGGGGNGQFSYNSYGNLSSGDAAIATRSIVTTDPTNWVSDPFGPTPGL